MGRTVDFDQAWEEHQRLNPPGDVEPEQVRMFGSVFPRKATLPAAVALWASRIQVAAETAAENGDGTSSGSVELGLSDLIELLRLIVPTDVLDDWVFGQGRSEDELRKAFLGLYAMYHGVVPETEGGVGSGEAGRPASRKRSSKAGRSSKPTSRANTKRTSTG